MRCPLVVQMGTLSQEGTILHRRNQPRAIQISDNNHRFGETNDHHITLTICMKLVPSTWRIRHESDQKIWNGSAVKQMKDTFQRVF